MQRQKLTLMFTDIVGYSRLMGQNESLTIKLVEHYRRILVGCIERHDGRVIEFIGDAVFASFTEAQASIDAAIEIQQALEQFNKSKEKDQTLISAPPLRTRIGLHSGEVTLKDGAPFGDDVNIAARLEPLAFADGICISQSVYEAIKLEPGVKLKYLGKQSLKNIEHKIAVYLIRPEGITARVHAHYAWKRTQETINKYRYAIACCFLSLIVAGVYFIPRWLVPGYTANYVEIADFKNLTSESGEADYFSAGITEALRSQLADMEDVYIVDPEDGVRGPVRLEGSVQRAGENVRIAYRLFRRKDNVQIAGGKLDGVYDDIFILQDRVVAEIAQFVSKEFDLKYFRPAVVRGSENVTAYEYYMKGLVYLKKPSSLENYDKAINFMTIALVHDSNDLGALIGLCRSYRGKYSLAGLVDFLVSAERYCKRALKSGGGRGDVLVASALVNFDKGNISEAQENLARALAVDVNNYDARYYLASLYEAQNDFESAEKIFLKALREEPGFWQAYIDYSYLLIGLSRFEEAKKVLSMALELTSENEPALSNLGVAHLYLGEFKEASKVFEKAVNISPTSSLYANVGTGRYYDGDFRESLDAYEKAIKLSPDDYRLYVNAADVVRYVEGKAPLVQFYSERAIDLAKKKLEVNEVSAEVYQYLAIAYFHLNDRESSEDNLEKASVLKPNDIELLLVKLRLYTFWGEFEMALRELEVILSSGFPVSLIVADPDLLILQDYYDFSLLNDK